MSDETGASELGTFLRACRSRLDPAALGFSGGRRRTPGLRREEVAQRASISATWYTWLEQGRGGAPSADVLDRLARALMLTEPERVHLFLIGLGHLPEVRYSGDLGVSPRLQRVLDAFEPSAAMIRTATYDVLAWNRAAPIIMADYGALPRAERNILRQLFLNPDARAVQYDWEAVARFVLGSFRADAARAGASAEIAPLVEDLCDRSPEFAQMWRENAVSGHHEAIKQIRHPILGSLAFEFSAFAVDGRSDLTMCVYNPVHDEDRERIRALIADREEVSVAMPA